MTAVRKYRGHVIVLCRREREPDEQMRSMAADQAFVRGVELVDKDPVMKPKFAARYGENLMAWSYSVVKPA